MVVNGLRSRHGDLLLKPWGWFSTHAGVRRALERRCSHGTKAHPPIQGSLTSATAIYPRLLCKRFVKVLIDDVFVSSSWFSQNGKTILRDSILEHETALVNEEEREEGAENPGN